MKKKRKPNKEKKGKKSKPKSSKKTNKKVGTGGGKKRQSRKSAKPVKVVKKLAKKPKKKSDTPSEPVRKIKVTSKLYGEHYRAGRGTRTAAPLNRTMSNVMKQTVVANLIAKSINDPLKPFKERISDGSMWWRLLSIVKKTLIPRGKFDFKELEGFEFDCKCPMERVFVLKFETILSGDQMSLEVKMTSWCRIDLKRDNADTYMVTLVVLFPGSVQTPLSQNISFPLETSEKHDHSTTWDIPADAKVVIILARCEFVEDGEPVGKMYRRAMTVLKVLTLDGEQAA